MAGILDRFGREDEDEGGAAIKRGHEGEASMVVCVQQEDVDSLVSRLNFAEKVDRSLRLIREAYEAYGDRLVVAHSLGKDSCVVWHLAKRVCSDIKGFIVTTRFKPRETRAFMQRTVAQCPELRVYSNDQPIPEGLYETDPDLCCELLKVEPTRRAIAEMDVACWGTGLRSTERRTRTDFQEIEERDEGLIKLNLILIWCEREIWQYLAVHRVPHLRRRLPRRRDREPSGFRRTHLLPGEVPVLRRLYPQLPNGSLAAGSDRMGRARGRKARAASDRRGEDGGIPAGREGPRRHRGRARLVRGARP